MLSSAPVPYRPDLHIRNRSEASFIGDNLYNTSGSGQGAAQSVGFDPVIYVLRVQNDGSSPDSFIITGSGSEPAGWRVAYYDSPRTGYQGGKDITAQVTGSGWRTPTLAPGQTFEFRADVTATSHVRGGAARSFMIQAVSSRGEQRVDVAKVTATANASRLPEIRRLNFDASGTYRAVVSNQGNVEDQFRVSGPGGGPGWTVRYFDAHHRGRDITDKVTRDGWVTPVLVPGQSQPILLQIRSTSPEVRRVTLQAASLANSAASDFAGFSTDKPPAPPRVFPIGVWSQPTYSFQKWKDRGINTLMKYEGLSGSVSMDQWISAANAHNLYTIREPRADASRDVHDPRLLAWMHHDEPDLFSQHRDSMAADYRRLKQLDPNRPWAGNLAGSGVVRWHRDSPSRDEYTQILASLDWPSNSLYPVTGWNRPEDLGITGRAIDRLQKWTEGKPQFAVIESSDQELPWSPAAVRGPTRAEFRAQIWDSIIHGAQGIIYFPQSFMPQFRFDNTPPGIEAEMRMQNARLADIGQVLLSPIDPPDMGLTANGPLEGTWRRHGGKEYFIVLNMSSRQLNNQHMQLHGVASDTTATVRRESRQVRVSGGVLTDSFGPYQAHVYELKA